MLDARPECQALEALVDVESLILDSSSAINLRNRFGLDGIANAVLGITQARGKMHNPDTDSGGIAFGKVREVGPGYPESAGLAPGLPVATLASLTLIPLALTRAWRANQLGNHLGVEGTAILFASTPVAPVPDDLPLGVALAVLDVAGAPAHVSRLARAGDNVLIIGAGGSAGLLSLVAARRAVGPQGRLVAADLDPDALVRVQRLGVADFVLRADATAPLAFIAELERVLPAGADLTVHVASVTNCEAACYLATKSDGLILFFSTATSFTRAALGAEGVAATAKMLIGNGYSPDRGEVALHLLRTHQPLYESFVDRFGGDALSDLQGRRG